jgi:putative hydroxymethylpyrimidine transport system substrate-binding protein
VRGRRLAALVVAFVLVAALAGCGAKSDTVTPKGAEGLRVMLDFFPNADHAGLYAAKDSGEFARAALDVHIQTPPDPATPLKLLVAGKVDLAISYEPELLLARDRGEPLVAVGAIVQRPLTSVLAVGSAKIRTPADLRGKRVGTAGIPYQAAYLRAILRGAHVDPGSVRPVSVGFDLVPAMLSKRVDATLGGFWNYEGIQLAQQGRKPTIIRVDQAGVPTYDELVLVARRDTLARRGDAVRRFVQALGRGYAEARQDPARAVDAIVRANPQADRRLQLASLQATLPAFAPPAGKPFGWQDARAWRAYADWMFRNRLLNNPPSPAAPFTNEFLPGQGT